MELKIPITVISKNEITHISRELRIFIDKITQSKLRKENPIIYPTISDSLRALAIKNSINLKDEKVCQKLLVELDDIKKNAFTIHISFQSEPSLEILQKLIEWLRKEIDPSMFIQVGLQPNIAAGIILRTPNHQFDFSLRQHLYQNKSKLIEALKV